MATQSIPAASDYSELRRLIIERGLLEPQRAYYWFKSIVALVCLAAAAVVAVVATHPAILIADAVFMGFAFTQVALLAHDTGHRQSFRGERSAAIARFVLGPCLLGISQSWWVEKHNLHHAAPNHVEKDPDIRLPFLAFSTGAETSKQSVFKPFFTTATLFFLVLLPFQALNMRFSSVGHLFQKGAPNPLVQAFGMALHFAFYGLLLSAIAGWEMALVFALVHHATFGVYNSSVFATNHKGMPLMEGDDRLDFFREQVLTTRNLHGHPFTDFWCGGLNYQIEHHLFPTMPRKNLRQAQLIVRAFCEERAVPYHATSMFTSYREALSNLRWARSLRAEQAVA